MVSVREPAPIVDARGHGRGGRPGCRRGSGDNKSATPTTAAPPSTITPAPDTTTAPAAAPKFSFGFIAPSAPLLLPTGFAQQNALSLAVTDINAGGGVLGAPVAASSTDDAVGRFGGRRRH